MKFVFLIAAERSGSNLITKLFDSHPEFCGPSPSHMIRVFSQNIGNYGDLSYEENWSMLLQDIVSFFEHSLGNWQTQVTAIELGKECKTRTLASLIQYIYQKEATSFGKTKIFLKETHILSFMPFLLSAFPNSKYIYLVRDPRDSALSWKKSKNHQGAATKGASYWQRNQNNNLLVYWSLFEKDLVQLVKYEDLIEQPETKLQQLCKFLGVEYSSQMLQFHKQQQSKINAKRLTSWENLDKPIIQKNKDKYLQELDPVEIGFVETICQKEMNALGYSFTQSKLNPEDWIEQIIALEKKEAFSITQDPIDKTESDILEKRAQITKVIQSRKPIV